MAGGCRCCSPHHHTKRRVFSKRDFSPEEERAFQFFLDEYRDRLGPVENDIEAWLNGATDGDLSSLQSIRSELEQRVGAYTADFDVLFREGGERGIEAGRQVAARRHNLDIAFDVVPQRTIDIVDEWAGVAAESTLETITEDSARWLRGAHEEGLGIDDIADQLNDELFDGRLEDYVAERAARTGTVATSNAGEHSAIEDSSAVAEQWITSLDDRERADHGEADGQVVAVDNTFEVGGEFLQHPGDPTASVGQIVNCRCSLAALFEDDLTADQLAAIEAGERIYL